MHVKPNPARVAETLALEGRAFIVRDPHLLDVLPAQGRLVPDNHHWLRLLEQGDVVQLTDAETATYTAAVADPAPVPTASPAPTGSPASNPAASSAGAQPAASAKQADRS